MKNNLLILSYMGTGKTELSKKYKNVIDLDFQDYRYIYNISIRHLPLEQRKGQEHLRTISSDYPNNFIKVVLEELEKGKIVVSPFIEHVFNAVDSNYEKIKEKNTRIILVFPNSNNYEEYAERFRKRGNKEHFIELRRNEFPLLTEMFNNADSKMYKKIIIKPNQFLSQALEEYKIELERI